MKYSADQVMGVVLPFSPKLRDAYMRVVAAKLRKLSGDGATVEVILDYVYVWVGTRGHRIPVYDKVSDVPPKVAGWVFVSFGDYSTLVETMKRTSMVGVVEVYADRITMYNEARHCTF